MRQVAATVRGFPRRTILRVVPFAEAAGQWEPSLRLLVRAESHDQVASLKRLVAAGLDNVALLTASSNIFECAEIPGVLELAEPLTVGDVVAAASDRHRVHVLYRESDAHHTVFLTNRCNSHCLMCSQPPTPHDDSWLVDEAKEIATHIRNAPLVLGFTGGEPLLLGRDLRQVLDMFARRHPGTRFDVLTNGRLFADRGFAHEMLSGIASRVTWMVPLYAHAAFLHDFVVQQPGAYEETLDGLLTLQNYAQSVQLRVVLIRPVIEVLPELCAFVARNLPFVREVALMGCEPVGFALVNRKQCEVDLSEWHDELTSGIRELRRGCVRPVLMNTPLCALPPELWPYAHMSISDWKRTFAPECESCNVKSSCSGLFSWHERGWRPAPLRAIDTVPQ